MRWFLIAALVASGCGDDDAPAPDGGEPPADSSMPPTDAAARPDVPVVPLPPGLGWTELVDTTLRDVCPPDQEDGAAGLYEFSFHCKGVTGAWSSGIADTSRSRMIVWGGGHADYYGNELYALDLNTRGVSRLNDPTIPTNRNDADNCNAEIPPGVGGFPNSRHSYGTLTYVEHADVMYAFGGSRGCRSGSGGSDTWTLDLATLEWRRMDPVNGPEPAGQLVSFADYDPATQLVYLLDRRGLMSYDVDTNTYATLNPDLGHGLNIHGIIDPSRHLFITIGPDSDDNPSLGIIDLEDGSTYERQMYPEDAARCPTMGIRNPGMAYDPNLDAIVIWGGGDNVDVFDPDTRTCTTMGGPGGPGDQVPTGTYGRFRYFPTHGVFAVLNLVDDNAYTLRLTE